MTDQSPPRLDHIVVGLDFGASSLAAAAWVARELAPQADLLLVHALDLAAPVALGTPPASPPAAQVDAARRAATDRLAAVAAALPRAGGAARVEVADDHPAWVVAHAAERSGADLIVVGPHAEEASLRSRLGSTAERLIRMSPTPVLMVATPPPGPPRRLLVPVDQVELTPAVLEWARLLAQRTGAHVTLLHVVAPDADGSAADESDDPRAWLAGLARELPGSSPVELAVAHGEPGEEILRAAGRAAADLIVMGRRGRGRVLPGVLGSTVRQVLRRAACPVLVVVDPRDAIVDDWDAH